MYEIIIGEHYSEQTDIFSDILKSLSSHNNKDYY